MDARSQSGARKLRPRKVDLRVRHAGLDVGEKLRDGLLDIALAVAAIIDPAHDENGVRIASAYIGLRALSKGRVVVAGIDESSTTQSILPPVPVKVLT